MNLPALKHIFVVGDNVEEKEHILIFEKIEMQATSWK